MAMRVTHGAMMNAYSAQAQKNLQKYNAVNTRALNGGRTFMKASEDVGTASIARRLYREESQANTHLANIDSVSTKFNQADAMMKSISDRLIHANTLMTNAVTDTMGDDERHVLATELREVQEQIVSALNTVYSGQYIFGGARTEQEPFKLKDGELFMYDPDATGPDKYTLNLSDDSTTTVNRIKALLGETSYTDIGWGMQVTTAGGVNTVVPGTAFDSAIHILEYLGYGGVDANAAGASNNIVTLLGQIADELDNGTVDRAMDMWDAFQDKMTTFDVGLAVVSAKYDSLTNTQKRLDEAQFVRAERIDQLMYNEIATVEELSRATYHYLAVLQIGSTILSQSLLDYLY